MTSLRHEAEEFINQQFEIMSRHGEKPSLSQEQMDNLITETEQTFCRLAYPGSFPHEDVPEESAE